MQKFGLMGGEEGEGGGKRFPSFIDNNQTFILYYAGSILLVPPSTLSPDFSPRKTKASVPDKDRATPPSGKKMHHAKKGF